MFILNSDFFICNTQAYVRAMHFVFVFLNVLRFVIPIGLLVMTVIDLVKNVFDPNDKDGMNVITKRFIGAVIVFLIPTLINLVLWFIDLIFDNQYNTSNYTLSSCYVNPTKCYEEIESFYNCDDKYVCQENNKEECEKEKNKCKNERAESSFMIDGNCNITEIEKKDNLVE